MALPGVDGITDWDAVAFRPEEPVEFVFDNAFPDLAGKEEPIMSGNYPDGSDEAISKLYYPDRFGDDDRNEYIQQAEEKLQELLSVVLEGMETWLEESVLYEEDSLWEGDIPYLYSLGIDRINKTVASREHKEHWQGSPEIALLKAWSLRLKKWKDEYQAKKWQQRNPK